MKKTLLLLSLIFSLSASSQIKISALPAMSGLCDTCKVPIVQSGVTKKAGGNQIAWGLKGTAGSTAGTHFLGTTDATALVIKTNATERMRINEVGNVGIGVSPSYNLEVLGPVMVDSIRIEASGSSSGQQTSTSAGIGTLTQTTGVMNTAFGYQNQTAVSVQSHNTTFGYYAGRLVQNHSNTAFGSNCLKDLTGGGGFSNTAMGSFAAPVLTTGSGNVALGKFAMFSASNTSASTVVGSDAGYSITTGTHNTALGAGALGAGSSGTGGTAGLTGQYNLALGIQSLSFVTSGLHNIGIGYRSGYSISTGSYNVILGENNGAGIATSNNNIILSDGQGNIRFQNSSGTWNTDQNISMTSAGNKLSIATGANASLGTATLVGGTVTVNTTAVTASSKIFVSVDTPGGTQGFLSVPSASIVAATSFVINSTSGTETSTVHWWILN